MPKKLVILQKQSEECFRLFVGSNLMLAMLLFSIYVKNTAYLVNTIKSRLASHTRQLSTLSLPPVDLNFQSEAAVESSTTRSRKIKRQIRQHVNPLTNTYKTPSTLSENWIYEAFGDNYTNDLMLDIGCAKGTWALNYAKTFPMLNVLGLEIRPQAVELCVQRKKSKQIQNAHFLCVNANVDLEKILNSLLKSNITINTISIQFPDPHFKKRNHKRRVVNKEFVTSMAKFTKAGTNIFLQSDVEDLMNDMISHFSNSRFFDTHSTGKYNVASLCLNPSPFEIQTEREISTLARGLPIYRMMYQRSAVVV